MKMTSHRQNMPHFNKVDEHFYPGVYIDQSYAHERSASNHVRFRPKMMFWFNTVSTNMSIFGRYWIFNNMSESEFTVVFQLFISLCLD